MTGCPLPPLAAFFSTLTSFLAAFLGSFGSAAPNTA